MLPTDLSIKFLQKKSKPNYRTLSYLRCLATIKLIHCEAWLDDKDDDRSPPWTLFLLWQGPHNVIQLNDKSTLIEGKLIQWATILPASFASSYLSPALPNLASTTAFRCSNKCRNSITWKIESSFLSTEALN